MPSRTLRAGHLLRLIAATGLVAGTLVIGVSPVGAAAPTKITIVADQPAAVPAGHTWGFNDFFPRSLTVHRGQTIQFVLQGFHTATLLPKGLSAATDLRTNGVAAADTDDTKLNPGGQTHSQIMIPALLPTSPTCGSAKTPCSFTGRAVVSSGAPLGPSAGPFVVTINAPVGTYTLHCRVHAGMTATIRVAPASVPATTPGAVTSSVKHQIAADIKDAFAAEAAADVVTSSTLPDGHTLWMATAGTASAGNHVAILEFLPRTLSVAPGDLVLWFPRAANEPHTITFPGELHTDQVALCEDASSGTDIPATPTVIPPTGPFDFACGTPPHPADEIEFAPGNGVRTLDTPTTVSDSGLIASPVATAALGLPATAALTTWTIGVASGAPAGTYTFVCQIHDGMKGTLVVGP
jgi:plastocyanin